MIYRILGAIKIGWVIGTLLASSLCAAGRPVPTRPIEPVPLPPADKQKARDAGSQEAKIQPADSRPVVYVHTMRTVGLCDPCDAFGDWWQENCDTAPFNIVPVEYGSFEELPQWVAEQGVPCVQYETAYSKTGWGKRPWLGVDELVQHWKRHNPKRVGELKGVKRA